MAAKSWCSCLLSISQPAVSMARRGSSMVKFGAATKKLQSTSQHGAGRMAKLTIIAAAVTAFAILGATAAVDAQGALNYPIRPVMMIVPLGTGGSTDTIARIMAEGLRAAHGQPVIVENVTGAGGTIDVGRLV